MSEQKSNTNLKELAYRAVIPFYVLWDTDLNGNDLRFYGQIEQMENHPNSKVNASFSYQWIADALGINRRNAINIANKLKKKGYITRTKINDKDYLWNTVKKGILVSSSDTPLVSSSDTPLVSSSDTQKSSKLKSNKSKDISASTESDVSAVKNHKERSPGKEAYDITPNELLIIAWMNKFPFNPHPRDPKKPSIEVVKAFNSFKKHWYTTVNPNNPLTLEAFENYLDDLKSEKIWVVNEDKDCSLVVFIRINVIEDLIGRVKAKQRKKSLNK